MPKSHKLSAREAEDYRRCLLRLEEMGVEIGTVGNLPPESARMLLEQEDVELARIYEFPGNVVAVLLFAKLTVLRPGSLIMEVEITTTWSDSLLELSDPESFCYQKVMERLNTEAPNILNPLLLNHVPLRERQEEGIILAHGPAQVPHDCPDETPTTISFRLTDQTDHVLSVAFRACLDRSFKRKDERQLAELRARQHSKRMPIFPPSRPSPEPEPSPDNSNTESRKEQGDSTPKPERGESH